MTGTLTSEQRPGHSRGVYPPGQLCDVLTMCCGTQKARLSDVLWLGASGLVLILFRKTACG